MLKLIAWALSDLPVHYYAADKVTLYQFCYCNVIVFYTLFVCFYIFVSFVLFIASFHQCRSSITEEWRGTRFSHPYLPCSVPIKKLNLKLTRSTRSYNSSIVLFPWLSNWSVTEHNLQKLRFSEWRLNFGTIKDFKIWAGNNRKRLPSEKT